MTDAIITYAIVAIAAGFVLWKLILPVRVKTIVRYTLAGKQAPCAPVTREGGCAGGCSGCGLAKVANKTR